MNKKKLKNEKLDSLETMSKKKIKNTVFTEYLVQLGVSSNLMLDRIEKCATYVEFLKNPDKPKQLRLKSGIFCKNRFCPICATRKATIDSLKVATIVLEAKQKLGYEFLFLTLTAPNVLGSDLKKEIDSYNSSFARFIKSKELKAINKGYIRKLEITYNKETDTYHPHFHIVLAVDKKYFKSRFYLSQARWLELWRHYKNDNSITQVNVKKLKFETLSQYFEIGTYATKTEDLFSSLENFSTFYYSLYGRQVLTYNGIFKELVKKLKDDELELLHFNNLEEFKKLVSYMWNFDTSKYNLHSEKDFTSCDIKKLLSLAKNSKKQQ